MSLDAAARAGSSPMRIPLHALHFPIPADQRIGAAVVFEVGFPGGFEFGDDALGEDFAEFDAPLVEGVDIP